MIVTLGEELKLARGWTKKSSRHRFEPDTALGFGLAN